MVLKENVLALGHIGVPTKDLENTVAFYEAIGFQIIHRTENPISGKPVAFLNMAGIIIEAWESEDARNDPGAIDHIALQVTDVDQVFSWIREREFRLLDQEVQYLPFWENGTRFFTIEGPNKEKIEFCQKL
ncbi:MAG: VOC family protein [Clostridiales bacterium]|nr:VOC family protein [Clostridiales bacterium]